MFWDKGYSASQNNNIESLLQKENVTLEEFLDDEDILQECKNQKRNLILYLTRPDIIKRLIELTITDPPEDLPVPQRFKHANMACEILTFGLPSLYEKLVEDEKILQTLYSYLENEPPLNPLLSSFFSKTFSMLISKRPEQDWFLYQKMCLQVLEFLKSRENFLNLIFKHFDTPVIMDLLLQIIKEVQGGALKKNLFEWLTEQRLVERLISILGQPDESEKHKNVAEFLCELIKHGRSMRQTDQLENDSFEPTFIGSNPLLQSIENSEAISHLLDVMLKPDAKESTIISGVTIVLTLVDETIVDEPASDRALQLIIDKEKENNEKIISTVIEVIEPKVEDLHLFLLNPLLKNELVTTATKLSPPFGLIRLQICRLFTVLLRTGNDKVISAISKTEFLNTLLKLFKDYCWNNFLHSEVEKCIQFIFCSNSSDNNNIKNNNDATNKKIDINNSEINERNGTENSDEINKDAIDKNELPSNDLTALQTYAIVYCKIITKLVDCWLYNTESQSSENGRRLGYMGHLIKIFNNIMNSISKSENLGALIESNLKDENELNNWHLITNQENGELIKNLNTQTRMLADCNAYESTDFGVSLPKEFNNENFASEFFNDLTSNSGNNFLDDDQLLSSVNESALDKLCEFFEGDNLINCLLTPSSGGDISLNLQRQLKVWDNMGNDMDNDIDLYRLPTVSDLTSTGNNINSFGITSNPWCADPFLNNKFESNNDNASSGWANFNSDNFADFDSHFSSFTNDLGTMINKNENKNCDDDLDNENCDLIKSDKNANIEKKLNKNIDEEEDLDNNKTTDEKIKKMIDGVVQDENIITNGPDENVITENLKIENDHNLSIEKSLDNDHNLLTEKSLNNDDDSILPDGGGDTTS